MKLKIKTCKNCNLDISIKHGCSRYCNQECYELWRNRIRKHDPVQKICKLCDMAFVATGKGMRDQLYCSERCHYISGIIRHYGDPNLIYKIWKISDKCKICKRDFESNRDKHVDHCHASGKVRGILCNRCNFGLGYFRDDKEALREAIKYLENV